MIDRRFDTTLLLITVVLTCFGVVMVYSASSIMSAQRFGDGFYFLKRQGLFAAVGFLLMTGAIYFDYRWLRKLAFPGLILCGILLVVVLLPGLGAKVGGAARWIRFPGFNLQPAELAKLGMILYLAHSLAKKQDKVKSFTLGFLPYMLVLGTLLMLLLMQPDLGSAMIIAACTMGMLLMAGTRWYYLGSIGLMAVPVLYLAVMTVDYRRRRIMAFLNPWADPYDSGFQIIQSLLAFGSGGLAGVGLGASKQKLFYLPEAHTDFIFSVVGEELGFIGVVVVAALFLLLVERGLSIAMHAKDEFGRYLAFGITLLLGLEAFINICVVMGLLPTKGLALPFISYGGTSLVTSLVAIGVLLNISANSREERS